MKAYKILISALLGVCLLCSCSSKENGTAAEPTASGSDEGEKAADNTPAVDTDSANQINSNKSDEDVSDLESKLSMTAVADSSGNVTVTITNRSDTRITAGDEYQLQKSDGTSWTDIPLSLVFSDTGIDIASGESRDFQYSIGALTSLEANTAYRIVKKAYVNRSEVVLTASFERKDSLK